MKVASDASALLTRLQACDGPLNHFIMRYIFPIQGQAAYADKLAELCCGAPKFEFLPVTYKLPASFAWKDERKKITAASEASLISNKKHKGVVMELTSLTALMLLFFFAFGSSIGTQPSHDTVSNRSTVAPLGFSGH